jgi:hypothetical protein
MIIDFNYKDENKGFSKLENDTIKELFIKLNNIQNQTSSLSKFEIFQSEGKLTDVLKKLLDICNKNVFSSFKLELTMVDDNENVY